ncbi:threonine--tRNA ligase [Candidatus Uhrbacteria bacterium CG10_big_fil_rev_8_21_14_0_10_48_16]|uniref:Threonine--tRNA ligase n=1 Tax=Candidatus Uhrbacteria bacterium CG10_big_fil_rev_8_21_14_0_10_48_16 TaxID=1975038 RepID=A0A2M8LFZ3_9BACT|nr:MAG: threonine--tRNA ligase [Candidatus Uhrbacteria bacterium CG10_big_fil_rev_8_21_14_0_10_48_16]
MGWNRPCWVPKLREDGAFLNNQKSMHEDNLHAMRHTAAHVLAAAAQRLYPGVKFGVGPVIENGFFYDILFPEPVSDDVLKKLEKEMHKIVNQGHEMAREEMSIDEAIAFFAEKDQEFKVELLKDLKEKGTTKINPEEAQDIDVEHPDTASIYKTGEFVDLCRGPHVGNTKEVGAFKLWKLAGAYWRGNEGNAQLQRIYGLCFETKEELDAYLTMLEEAKKRDHRKLGKELDLFIFSDLVGPGLPMWTPKGTILRNKLDEFVWSLRQARGYQKVEIPHITKKELYETSGHWEKFQDELFKITTREGHVFAMKPMNCPHHTQIFDRKQHSYREMPQRLANTTMCYRDEQTGELHGLSRLRSFTQDDAHVFCRESQVKEEAMKIWDIIETFYGAFGFSLRLRLSTHDPNNMEKYLGGLDLWDKSVSGLKEMLDERGAEYFLGVGEAAFYGPKIDFITKDSIGREWQVATIQLDRNLPERFNLSCVNEAGEPERIVMIHAAIMGAIERFLSVMIEHTAGAFPFWLAPVQIVLATVSQDYIAFAKELEEKLRTAGVRVELDASHEKLGRKIRDAAKNKVPWTIVIGAQEADGGDFKVNVFGQEEDLLIEAGELIDRAKQESQFPE